MPLMVYNFEGYHLEILQKEGAARLQGEPPPCLNWLIPGPLPAYTAFSPVSPVRMRITSATG